MNRWRGKVAIVTGASAGIGVALVKELLKNDLVVVGIARRTGPVEVIFNEHNFVILISIKNQARPTKVCSDKYPPSYLF